MVCMAFADPIAEDVGRPCLPHTVWWGIIDIILVCAGLKATDRLDERANLSSNAIAIVLPRRRVCRCAGNGWTILYFVELL